MKIGIKRSFKFKLVLSYILVVVISFGLATFFLDKNLEENSLKDLETSLINQGYLIESQIPIESIQKEKTVYLEELVRKLSAKINSRISIINNDGRVLADSEVAPEEVSKMENHRRRPEIKSAFDGEIGINIRHSSTLKMDMLYVALPLRSNSKVEAVIRLALPLESVQRTLFTVKKAILMGIFFAFGLAFLLGSLLAKGIIKPINRIILASRKFAKGDFSHRIFHDSEDEIGELAARLNKMAQDLEDKIRQIRNQNQQLGAVLNSMIEGVLVVDNLNRILSINPTIEKIFNISKEGAVGKYFLEAVSNNDLYEIINSVLKKGEIVSAELNLLWPIKRVFQVHATPITEKESVKGCLLVIHDITEIRRLERVRSDFVANVSHELKTPLTSIKGFVETLLEGAMEDKKNSQHFLKIIQEHTDRLNNLINDLLELSQIESKEIKLEIKELNLKELCDKTLSGFRVRLKKSGLQVQNELPENIQVRADKDKIEQVLTNLVDNAIKFNKEQGKIKIYSEEFEGKIKVTVEDSGIGIPVKDIPRIFERFYRVDKARSRQLGGTGLGLSIVKHIVELHGGAVGVESTEALGSKFFFTLPK